MTRTFEARYGGRCGVCDGRIEEGDTVAYEDDELVHADCVEEPPPFPKRRPMTDHGDSFAGAEDGD